MKKMLIIGDYENSKHIELAQYIIDKYSSLYDMCISGRNLKYANNSIEISEKKRKIVKKTSNKYSYYLICAAYVIILDDKTNFVKYKSNQEIIILSQKNVFDALKDDIDMRYKNIVYSAKCQYALFGSNKAYCYTINKSKIFEFESSLDNATCDEIFANIEISLDDENVVDVICITNNQMALVRSENNLLNIKNQISKVNKYNLILITLNNDNIQLSDNISPGFTYITNIKNKNAIINRFLNSFEGFVLYDDISDYYSYHSHLINNGVDDKSQTYIKLENTKLLINEDNIFESMYNLGDNVNLTTKKYQEKLKKFANKDIQKIKISVVICYYNTNEEILVRAINSVLESTHENIELVLINDGSKVNNKESIFKKIKSDKLEIKYIYQENQGSGLAKNIGVKNSTGDYVIFLDSNDTIEPNGLELLAIHSNVFNLDLVIGKSVTCDDKGRYMNESLNDLYGNSYKCYFNDFPSNVYNDEEINNKLIRRGVFDELDIWFVKGYYENLMFNTELFSKVKKYHYANVHIHNKYKCSEETVFSAFGDFKDFLHKYIAINDSWNITPEFVKTRRLNFHLCSDFANYYLTYPKYSLEEKICFFNSLKEFYEEKKSYLSMESIEPFNKNVVYSLENNNIEMFSELCNDLYDTKCIAEEECDNYLISTFYHLLIAIMYTLKNKRPARLFIYQSYINFDRKLIDKLSNLGLFKDIVELYNGNIVGELHAELAENPDEAKVIIPSKLYLKYVGTFERCNQRDNMYIFSDTLPYWYFVERYFDNIIKLEDAYSSFKRETELSMLTGLWKEIHDNYADLMPEILFKSNKIKKIIVSEPIKEIDTIYSDRIVVENTAELMEDYKVEMATIVNDLFNSVDGHFNHDTILLLTQPLAHLKYCTKKQQMKLYKNILSHYKKKNVVIKPHPADPMNYNNTGYKVINKNLPIEVYNFLDVKINEVVTFGSSGVNTIKFADKLTILFKQDGFEFSDVTKGIKQITNEKKPPLKYRLSDLSKRIIKKIKRTLS